MIDSQTGNDSVKTMTQTPVPAIALGYPERDEFAFESDQFSIVAAAQGIASGPVSYTHLRAHETN